LKLADRHRINPKKKKKEDTSDGGISSVVPPSSPKLRRKGCPDEPSVHYISKSVYSDDSSPHEESAEDFIGRINEFFSLKIKNDADSILEEIFKRGWKVSHIEPVIGRTFLIRFNRGVGGQKSRTIQKKDRSLKKLLLRALEYILREETGRYSSRMRRAGRGRSKG
jgi:hypothetical protein